MERTWCVAVLLLVCIGIVIPSGFAEAASVSQLINTLLLILAKILEWIILFVARLVILIIDVVIQVAQYNNFVNSAPVNNGWPLVRDVTNMFFIVILLVTAFGTIVQYQKLHYRAILPKLLLMAVLVNFSKTLIGLLIDFSQVLMLTFVNGFKAAAGGNFVGGLKLNEIMKLGTQEQLTSEALEGDAPKDSMLLQIVIAEMLAMFFLGITIVMLLIMLVYLLVRIVGLWIALILSPFAFFLTAVPDFLAQKVSGVSENYWGKLGALLSGGPIMAFFLWLTLATVQGEGFGEFTSKEYAGAKEAEQILAAGPSGTGFASAVGNIEDFATFFIAIIMLLMGVEAAVSIGSQISGKLGAFTGKIKDVGIKGAKFAAYGGVVAGGAFAARGAYRAGRAVARVGAREAEARLGVAERVGRGVQRVGLAVGMPGLAAAGARAAGVRRRAVEREAKRFEEATAGLSTKEYMGWAERGMRSTNRSRARALTEKYVKRGVTSDGYKEVAAKYEKEGEKQGLSGSELEAYKGARANERMAELLAEYKRDADAVNDEDKLKWHKEQLEKNPQFAENPADFVTKQLAKDPTYYRKMSADAYGNTDVVRAYLRNSGDVQGDTIAKDSYLQKLMRGNSFQAKAVRDYVDRVTTAKGKDVTLEQALENDDLLQKSGLVGGRFARGESPKDPLTFVSAATLATAAAVAAEKPAAEPVTRPRREGEIASGKRIISRRREEYDQAGKDYSEGKIGFVEYEAKQEELRRAQLDAVKAGANMSEAYRVNSAGTFADESERARFEKNVTTVQEEGKADVTAYNSIDGLELHRNAQAFNEARNSFVQNVSINDLSKAARDAKDRSTLTGDRSTLKNIGDLARAVDVEGAQAEGKLSQALRGQGKVGDLERDVIVKDAVKAARTGDESALKKTLTDGGLREDTISMDDAKMLLKRQQMKDDTTLKNFAHFVTGRAGRAIHNVKGAGAEAAGAVGAAGAAAARKVERGGRKVTGRARAAGEFLTPEGRLRRRRRRAGEQPERPPEVEPPRGEGGETRGIPWAPPPPPTGGGTPGAGEPGGETPGT